MYLCLFLFGAQSVLAGSSAVIYSSVSVLPSSLEAIVKQPLDFGYINSSSQAGYIEIDHNGKRSGNYDAIDYSSKAFPSVVAIYGSKRRDYEIKVPDRVMFDNQEKTGTLEVTNITVFSKNANRLTNLSYLDEKGMDTLTIGGRLNIKANSARGNYKGEIDVQVDYR